jgi:hypothetical protein
MVRCGILDFPIFLPRSSSALLMADVSVAAISCVVASMAKTLSKSRPSLVEVHRWWHPWPVPPRAKEGKVDTSSAEVPTAPVLVARPKSKAPNDNLGDDNPDLLNFAVVGSEISCQTSSRLQSYWPDSGKLDCPIWDSGWSNFHTP